ncbi:MAG: hypothetical protein ACRCTE_14480 [Cellulosilyticaceae bacterium]
MMFIIAIISMVMPTHWIIMIMMGIISVHLMSFNLVLGGLAIGVFGALYILFIRFYPKESFLVVITIIAMKLGIAYVIPIAVPIVGGMVCLVPIMIGVITYELGIQITIMMNNNMIVGEAQEIILMLLGFIQNNIILNPKTLATLGVFVIVFILVSIIKRQNIDYAAYVAIIIGSVINLLGFGIAILVLEIELSVLILVLMTILSAIIAIIIQYLSCVVDYSRAEIIHFEDDEHIYYVRVIPKVKINANKTKIEQIYTRTSKEDLNHLTNDIY